MKLSFKRQKRETGLAAIANPYAIVDIKKNKKVVGCINPPSRFGGDFWKVKFAVTKEPTEGNPTPFKWISFKFEGKSEEEARDFVTKNWDLFVTKYDMYEFDEL